MRVRIHMQSIYWGPELKRLATATQQPRVFDDGTCSAVLSPFWASDMVTFAGDMNQASALSTTPNAPRDLKTETCLVSQRDLVEATSYKVLEHVSDATALGIHNRAAVAEPRSHGNSSAQLKDTKHLPSTRFSTHNPPHDLLTLAASRSAKHGISNITEDLKSYSHSALRSSIQFTSGTLL